MCCCRQNSQEKSRDPRAWRGESNTLSRNHHDTCSVTPKCDDEPNTTSLFAWLISHQPTVLFSQNKPATGNQPAVLFSQNKPAPAISHQPTEQALQYTRRYYAFSLARSQIESLCLQCMVVHVRILLGHRSLRLYACTSLPAVSQAARSCVQQSSSTQGSFNSSILHRKKKSVGRLWKWWLRPPLARGTDTWFFDHQQQTAGGRQARRSQPTKCPPPVTLGLWAPVRAAPAVWI
jgi:hypothetical protein